MEESWLSEEGIINPKEFVYGKLNIIDAPCGCGKTTFVEHKLWEQSYWGKMLYLIDTKNALEAFQHSGVGKETVIAFAPEAVSEFFEQYVPKG